MSRPIPGVQSLEYRRDGQRRQRCSRCHAERSVSVLVHSQFNASDQVYPIMVGQDLVGVLCSSCVMPFETALQATFPDGQAYPWVDSRGVLMPTPRCDDGHVLVYASDGRSMVCPTCDAEHVDLPGGFGDAPMGGPDADQH